MAQATSFPEYLVELALQAMTLEVTCGPKPGLVDPFNTGSHQDMDQASFMRSIRALEPHLLAYAQAGPLIAEGLGSQGHRLSPPAGRQIFSCLQKLGLAGEVASLAANKGVNCHAGLNFAWALILPVAAYLYRQMDLQPRPEAICQLVSQLAGPVYRDWQKTSGRGKAGGARLAAAQGYRLALDPGLVILRAWGAESSFQEAMLLALAAIMAQNADSNILRRGGDQALVWVQAEAQSILDRFHPQASSPLPLSGLGPALDAFDQAMIGKNLSPGGSADLLALAVFFYLLETDWYKGAD